MITEDTLTQGAGHWELELGNGWAREGGNRRYELGPQLSYGWNDSLDLILRPTWNDVRAVDVLGSGRARGAGDTAVDFKWQFAATAAWSLAVRAGLNAPSGDADRGLGRGRTTAHALLAATIPASELSIHANIGYTQNRDDAPARDALYHLSSAAVLSLTPSFRLLLADVTVDSEPDPRVARWQCALRVGAIGVVRTGFDLDIGYQTRLGKNGPTPIWLAGATVRW